MPSYEVGETFELDRGPVTTVQLVMYAGASGDFNRIHYDLPFAQEAGLGGVIAHGMLTMGFAGQLLTNWAGPRAFVKAISARFVSSVRPGDTVRLRGTVTAIEPVAGASIVSVDFTGAVQDREVISGAAKMAFPA
ncbi:MAG: dehydratase [Alphaproteobacteria bacterium]|nr:dehydratase [Alphaproteobacteria bacterium]